MCTLACSVILITFSDLVPNGKIRYEMGYLFIGVYILNFGVNVMLIAYSSTILLYLRLKRMFLVCQKRRLISQIKYRNPKSMIDYLDNSLKKPLSNLN